MDIVVVGAGRFGSALAHLYKNQGRRVSLIGKSDAWPGDSAKKQIVLLCTPTQKISDLASQRGDALRAAFAVVSTSKGILAKTGQTPLQYLTTALKIPRKLFCLSGPSFASELMEDQPSALVLAGKNKVLLEQVAKNLLAPRLRIYKSTDPLGVELCGAFKNIYAVASGISDGLGFKNNTRAALNTRALAEMSRIGRALGGKPQTFFGLAGVGDLFLTATSAESRNYRFGFGLASGKSQEQLFDELGTVEGAWTAPIALKICRSKKISTPILETVAALLSGKLAPQEALGRLMTREVRHEFD